MRVKGVKDNMTGGERTRTVGDLLIGYAGVFLANLSTLINAAAYWVPWILGVACTAYALYNQHQTAKLNAKKLKKYNDTDDGRKTLV